MTKLSGELDRLSGLPVHHPPVTQQASHLAPTSITNTVSPQPQPRRNQGCCTAQLQTLSLSLNQVYAALWGLQRELTRTSERVSVLEEGREGSSRQGRPASRESLMSSVTRREEWPTAGGEVIWPGVGGNDQSFSAPGFHHMSSSPSRPNPGGEWGSNIPPWPSHHPTLPPDHHLSPFPSRDLWNSLQVRMIVSKKLLAIGKPEIEFNLFFMFSGLTRLFPPQPFLDASPPPSPPRPLPLSWSFPTREGLWRFIGSSQQPGPESLQESHTDFLFQVSPGVRANNYYDNFRSYSRQNRLSGGAPANLRAEGEPANNLPSSRPRRKYKINREQNR